MHTDAVTFHALRFFYRTEVIGGQLRAETNGSTDACRWWREDDCRNLVDIARDGLDMAFGRYEPSS